MSDKPLALDKARCDDLLHIGKIAYNASCSITEFKNHEGERLPTWDALTPLRRVCWMAAAAAVAYECRHLAALEAAETSEEAAHAA